jgi:hypothetical protein
LPALAGLSACGSTGLFNRARPDEMQVTRNAPLVVPPDFALVPPAPGAAPTVTPEANRQAMEALFGPPAARSARRGRRALVRRSRRRVAGASAPRWATRRPTSSTRARPRATSSPRPRVTGNMARAGRELGVHNRGSPVAMDIEPIHILTTGGTIDKIYFDALSDYQVGESVIARLLEIARVAYPFEIEGRDAEGQP